MCSIDLVLEVATFRSGDTKKEDGENLITDASGKILRDNIWGTLEQDCHRRDFTINALYYCPITKKIEDNNGGLKHIHKKLLFLLEILKEGLKKIQ